MKSTALLVLMGVLLVAPIAAEDPPVQLESIEVELTNGRVFRAFRIERRKGKVVIYRKIGSMSVAESKVKGIRELSVTEAESPEPDPPGWNQLGTPAAKEAPRRAPASRLRPVREGSGSDLAKAGLSQEESKRFAALIEGRRFEEAETALRMKLIESPGDAPSLTLLGFVLAEQGRFQEAVSVLRQADSAEGALRTRKDLLLAESLSRLDRLREAVAVLDFSPPDAEGQVAKLRAQLQEELEASSGLGRYSSAHFKVHITEGLSQLDVGPLLRELEEDWQLLADALGDSPSGDIVVVLYPGTEFWEATGMGSGVGGLYDGKVRVPAGRLDALGGRMSAVLLHELSHAFVDALTRGRANRSWQEGIAQHFEGRDVTRAKARLVALAKSGGGWPPPFSYDTAHVRVEWFLETYGMGELRDLLAAVRKRGTIDAGLQASLGLTHAELDERWRESLQSER